MLELQAAPLLAIASNNVSVNVNDFALRLSAELSKGIGSANFVASPFSVWLPLAALVNATDAAHKEELLSALGAMGVTENDLNEYASQALYHLTNENSKNESYYYNPLRIANALFVDDNVTLKKDFAQKFLDFYRGAAFTVDFDSQEAVKAVNKWASDNTDGLITDVVDSFDSSSIAAIANAIYFEDRWTNEFNIADTAPDIFHGPDGDITADFMLHEGNSELYYEDDLVQAMPLSFISGGSMRIILPKDGDATGLLQSMTDEYFRKIKAESRKFTGKLLLPKFELDSGIMDLNTALQSLGIPLFDEAAAPLTNGVIEESMPVWLGKAVQKAYIKVDEKGTTAAAVTIMAMAGIGMTQPAGTFEMKCDKPFVFILSGKNDVVLFAGVVNKP
jgi:serpin B